MKKINIHIWNSDISFERNDMNCLEIKQTGFIDGGKNSLYFESSMNLIGLDKYQLEELASFFTHWAETCNNEN